MTDYSIALSKVPNQTFTTNINGSSFEFSFRSFRGLMYANVTIDGVLRQAGVRCVPNANLFKSAVNIAAGGIFRFNCLDDSYPSYTGFDGTTCRFVYVPFSEV